MGGGELIDVPDFRGMQTLNAWLAGHGIGLLLSGPDPDSADPLVHGIVRGQWSYAGAQLRRSLHQRRHDAARLCGTITG